MSRKIRNYKKEYYIANKARMKKAMASYTKRKRQFIAAFKNKPCADCHEWFHPVQMDFDHRPGEVKLFSISQPKVLKLIEFYKEMKKCDLVCANCHRLRTYRRNQHGASDYLLSVREKDRGLI